MKNGSKIPHTLRLAIFVLRVTIGLNFFYLGFGMLFNNSLGRELGARSLTSLYQWLSVTTPSVASINQLQIFFQWAFFVIGAFLIIGLFIRITSILGIALTLAGYLPTMNFASIGASQFINDEIIVIACLLVLAVANAGTYLGADSFIHIHLGPKHGKSES